VTTTVRYKKLLEPGYIGTLKLKNRIIMAPMGTNFATSDGFVTKRLKDYYEERARGGSGLIMCGVLAVDAPYGRNMEFQIAISDAKYVRGLSEITDVVHRHGTSIAAQLVHGGKLSVADMIDGVSPVSPSESPIDMKETLRDLTRDEFDKIVRRFAGMPRVLKNRELTREDIGYLVDRFAGAAARARKSGFDGVEIHAAHGYLISSFLSPIVNKRQDEYGGDLNNRARFLLEIIGATRERVGRDYPVWCRIDCREFGIKNGITAEDGVKLADMLERAGVDAIHVSGYGGTIGGFIEAPVVYPPGNLVRYAGEIKRSVRIPIITVGRISPELAESLLRRNQADFIAMGRPLLADPELPKKLASGKRRDIRPCVYCYNCVSRHLDGEATVCTVNAAAGREKEFNIRPAECVKTVLVIGGGPAGMEAARVAALKGHRVTLLEKEHYLGGSLFFAAIANEDLEDLPGWMIKQVRKLPINIQLGRKVEPGLIEELKPDVIIVATGPGLKLPQIHVDGNTQVISGQELRGMLNSGGFSGKVSLLSRLLLLVARPILRKLNPSQIRWLTKIWLPLGKNVAIIGGDLVSVELAGWLSERGRKVSLLTEQQDIATDMHIPARWRVLRKLRKDGVTLLSDIRIESIIDNRVLIKTYGGDSQSVKADTVILAGETTSENELFNLLKDRYTEVYQIGECSGTQLLQGAIIDGTRIGLRV
jgi:2,4-dienoyl-CoA reductase-like NADH-dependent reductase (Old Yellow Enzyme family)